MKDTVPSPSQAFIGYVHPFAMDDILMQWGYDDPIKILKAVKTEDFTPALPFIQKFENPLFQSVIGEYADFGDFGTVHHEISKTLSDIATEMSYKFGLSVAATVEATGGADAVEGDSLTSIASSQGSQSSPA